MLAVSFHLYFGRIEILAGFKYLPVREAGSPLLVEPAPAYPNPILPRVNACARVRVGREICPVWDGWTGRYKTLKCEGIAFVAAARFLGGQHFVSPRAHFR